MERKKQWEAYLQFINVAFRDWFINVVIILWYNPEITEEIRWKKNMIKKWLVDEWICTSKSYYTIFEGLQIGQ